MTQNAVFLAETATGKVLMASALVSDIAVLTGLQFIPWLVV